MIKIVTATLELRTRYPKTLHAVQHVKIPTAHLHPVDHCSIGNPHCSVLLHSSVTCISCSATSIPGLRIVQLAKAYSGPLMLFPKLATRQLSRETFHDCIGGTDARVTNCGLP
jgi:hypothetical protein